MKLKDKQEYAKKWIDQNCHDGEDRANSNDRMTFDPDELYELIDYLLKDLEKKEALYKLKEEWEEKHKLANLIKNAKGMNNGR